MKNIIIFLLYIISLSNALSVTFPTFKKNYTIVQNIKVNKLVKYNKNNKTFKNKIENDTIKIQKNKTRIEYETKKRENNTFKKYFTSSNNYNDSHDFDSFKIINYQDIIIRD
tara:strand:+ start:687 stop:1022 length:336 start_codon:yes stop_codon:yes gene_type:complete